MINKIISFLIGDSNTFSFKQMILHYFLYLIFLLSLISAIINYLINLPFIAWFLPVAFGLITILIYILSRVLKKSDFAGALYFFLMILIFTPSFWLTNAGNKGSFQYYIILEGLMISAIFISYKRIIALIILIVTFIALTVIGNLYPSLIIQYKTAIDREIDISINMILAILFSATLFIIYLNQYNFEHKRMIEYANKLEKLANTDGLTELYNHRYIFKALEDQIERYKRYNEKFSIMMLDIDDFKSINDVYGHQIGDSVLMLISKTIKENIRKIDIIGRYGGEEFLIIIPHTVLNGAKILAEKIRTTVKNMFSEEDFKITISGGISEYTGENSSDFIKKADDLLYKAKKNGKNRIEHIL